MSLAGCAQLEYRSVSSPTSDLPRRVELVDTPFHAQTLHHCGPASLAMLLNASNISVSPEQLAEVTYLPGREGSLGLELLATPRQYELMGYRVTPSLEALLAEVASGRPALVLQNLGLSWLPRWHYAVVIGFDLDKRAIILRSGSAKRQIMPMRTFERTWRRGERWAMLVLKPGDMPAMAREVDYLNAILGLEKAGATQEVAEAYQAALEQWPNSVSTWMGWGNVQYASGDLASAADAFRQAIAINDTFAPAYNNLAQVMAETGQRAEAERLIHLAIEQGGSYSDVYQQTLSEIEALKLAAEN